MTITHVDFMSKKRISLGVSYEAETFCEFIKAPGQYFPASIITIGLIFISIRIIKPALEFIEDED